MDQMCVLGLVGIGRSAFLLEPGPLVSNWAVLDSAQ